MCRMTSQKMGHHVTDMLPLMWLWCFLCKKGENLSNISSWNSHYCVCFLSTKLSFKKVQTCLNLGSEWCHHFLKPWVINQKVLYVKTNLNLCTLSDIKDFSISHHITKKRGVPKLRRTCGHPVYWSNATHTDMQDNLWARLRDSWAGRCAIHAS